MAGLTDQDVDVIARRVVERMGSGAPAPAYGSNLQLGARTSHPESRAPGVFGDLDSAVKAATQAYQALDAMTLATRDRIIASIRETMLANAESLAREAQAETGFGRWEDKLVKNRLVTTKTPGTEHLRPDAMSG